LLFSDWIAYLCGVPVRRASKPSADRILEAAEATFAKHGYADVSLRQLMTAAGVSTTAFYARFDSKEAVMAALVTRLFSDLYAAAPGVLDRAKDLETGIEVGVDLLCDLFGPRQALVRIILSEAGSAPAAVLARRSAYSLLASFLAARMRRFGRDPDALAWALVGALEIQVVRWAVWREIDLATLRAQLRATARAMLPTAAGEPA
jgi:AcrR family transcriptional regulator